MKKFLGNHKKEAEDQTIEAKTSIEEEAREAAQAIVRSHALESIWPSSKKDFMKNHSFQMCIEVAGLFNRQVDDLSLGDFHRAQQAVDRVCGRYGVNAIRWGHIQTSQQYFEKFSTTYQLLSHIYWAGNLAVGNFGPAVNKLGFKVSGSPLARATGIWLVGQAIIELYWDPKGYEAGMATIATYHPLFDSLTLEHYRELALLMQIDARVAWDQERLREEILSELTGAFHNKISALWENTPAYQKVLISLCEELEIPNYELTDSEQVLEERIVQSVLAVSIDKISPEQLKKLEGAIKSNLEDGYWKDSLQSTLLAGGLVAGRLTGFGLYASASTATAAFANGLGISFAFGTYSTLSSALGLIFGPVGISLSLGHAAFHLTKARPKKALPFVLYMAAIRGKVKTLEERKPTFLTRAKWVFRRLLIFRAKERPSKEI